MSKQRLDERFTREQVLHALETTNIDCKETCPYEPALNDYQVLVAVAERLLKISKSAIKTGTSTEALAFTEGFHFGMRLAELENEPDPDTIAQEGQNQQGRDITHVPAVAKSAIPLTGSSVYPSTRSIEQETNIRTRTFKDAEGTNEEREENRRVKQYRDNQFTEESDFAQSRVTIPGRKDFLAD